MIDSTRSPVLPWKRRVRFVTLLSAIVALGLFIWTQELHYRLPI